MQRIEISDSILLLLCHSVKHIHSIEEQVTLVRGILGLIGDKKHTIQRSKGLGENEPDMMWMTTMNPKTRRLIQVHSDEIAEMEYMFDTLLGDNLQERKDYIAKNGSKYLDLTDVS